MLGMPPMWEQPVVGEMRKAEGGVPEVSPKSYVSWALAPVFFESLRGLGDREPSERSWGMDPFGASRARSAPLLLFPTELRGLERHPLHAQSLILLSLLGKPIRRWPPARPPDKFV